MMSDPYNPKRSIGLPTTYQDTTGLPELEQQGGPLKGEAPEPYPGPAAGMWQLDQMLQKRKEADTHRQMLAQMLATPQQQGPPPQPVPTRQVVYGPPVVQTSPWTILSAGINAFTKAYGQQGQGGGAAPGATSTSGGGGLTG
jgi:hypothetical protein